MCISKKEYNDLLTKRKQLEQDIKYWIAKYNAIVEEKVTIADRVAIIPTTILPELLEPQKELENCQRELKRLAFIERMEHLSNDME